MNFKTIYQLLLVVMASARSGGGRLGKLPVVTEHNACISKWHIMRLHTVQLHGRTNSNKILSFVHFHHEEFNSIAKFALCIVVS